MVGGTTPPQSDSGEISRVLVLNLLWQSKRCSRTAQDISVLTTPSLLSMGTPAPPFPTRHLVVTGLYRYVRNPMYVAVVGLIAGQALLLGNRALLFYAIIVWMAFQIFVLLYEEPVLRKTYTAEYEVFCRNVPRWIPRLSAWNAPPSR